MGKYKYAVQKEMEWLEEEIKNDNTRFYEI